MSLSSVRLCGELAAVRSCLFLIIIFQIMTFLWQYVADLIVHCTALHCTALHCTALHCTASMQLGRLRSIARVFTMQWFQLLLMVTQG